jgi:uncharacterized protein (DUF2141 family)
MSNRRNGIAALATVVAVCAWMTVAEGQGGRGGRAAGPGGQGAGRGGPPRDAAGATIVGTASISGTVTVEGSGAPVRRARVSLSGQEVRGSRSAITDDSGRFSFPALPAGRFSITASKAGFVDIAYGAKRPGRPGTPIQLAEGQKIDRLAIQLPRGSVLTGVVVDEHGEPAPGTPVRALRFVMRTGEKTLQQVGQDQTDDRGIYRIYQLQPGEYIVNALPRNMTAGDLRQTLATEVESLMQQVQQSGGGRGDLAGLAAGRGAALGERLTELQLQLEQTEQERSAAYAPVYYPGTTSPSSAATVTLGVGEERAGVDFQLQLVPTARVEGTVVGPDGTVPQGTQVALASADRAGLNAVPGLGTNTARVGAGGRFVFNNVTPGDYTVQARAPIRDPNAAANTAARGGGRGGPAGNLVQVLWAAVPIGVSGQDLTDVVLSLQPGMTVGGRVEFEGGAPPPETSVRVSLASRGSQTFDMGPMPQAVTDASGRFTLNGVAPGRYTLSAAMAGGGGARGGRGGLGAGGGGSWVLKSALVNGRDALDFPMEVAPNQELSGALLTFTNRTQELSGTIQDTTGRPTADFTIIVFPAEPAFWLPQARRISSTRPGTDGRFTFRGLPAGNYRLTAVTDVEPGEWYDPAFLGQLQQVSIPITLAEGDRKVQDIRLAGG